MVRWDKGVKLGNERESGTKKITMDRKMERL
jgi:hypothetical protein